MGEHWVFYFDPSRCIGCHACQSACKNRHDVDEDGVDWRRVEHVRRGTFPDYEEIPISLSCMHCEDPPCRRVCPTGAVTKRDSDGVVVVDREKCIGCHYCSWACPYGAPQFGSDGKMQKCNFCLSDEPGQALDAPAKAKPEDGGTPPACVQTCVGDALKAGPVSEMMDEASQSAAERFAKADGSASVIIEDQEAAIIAPDGTAD